MFKAMSWPCNWGSNCPGHGGGGVHITTTLQVHYKLFWCHPGKTYLLSVQCTWCTRACLVLLNVRLLTPSISAIFIAFIMFVCWLVCYKCICSAACRPPRWRGGSRLDCGSENPGSISRHTITACGPSDGKEVKDVFGHPGARVGPG